MNLFTKAELQQVERAIVAAEQKTTGEIVPLICVRAEHYFEGAYIFSILCTICFSFLSLASPVWITVHHLLYGQLFAFLPALH